MQEPTPGQATEQRVAVARHIANAYAAEPTVVALVCAGSTARGHADRWSDLELLVVWRAIPDDAKRRGIIAAAGGREPLFWAWDEREGACYDAWWHGGSSGTGLQVEATLTTPPELASKVEALARGEADPPLLTLGDAIVNGIPLIGGDVLAIWRARLTPYPRDLAVAVARGQGQIDHFWRWQMYVERDNRLQLAAYFADVAVRVVHVACALSGVWWPGGKWMMRLATQLPVAPADLAERLQRVSCVTPIEAGPILVALVEETYDLVEVHLPEVDVARQRAIFHFERRTY